MALNVDGTTAEFKAGEVKALFKFQRRSPRSSTTCPRMVKSSSSPSLARSNLKNRLSSSRIGRRDC